MAERPGGSRVRGWSWGLRLATLAAVALLMGTARPARAQAEKLPTAEEVLDKSIDALGGKAALEKQHIRVTKGTFELPPMTQKGTLVSYEAAPNKFYQAVELPGLIQAMSGSDGEVYWEIAGQAVRILAGEEKAFKVRDSRFNAPLYWRSLYQKAECVGVENVDDHPCYKVVMTPELGNPQTYYYDCQTYLPRRMDVLLKAPEGGVRAEVHFEDYKPVDGVLFPHKINQKMTVAGRTSQQIMTYDTIECNVDLPAERFALPAPVKAALEKSKTTPASKPAAPEPAKP